MHGEYIREANVEYMFLVVFIHKGAMVGLIGTLHKYIKLTTNNRLMWTCIQSNNWGIMCPSNELRVDLIGLCSFIDLCDGLLGICCASGHGYVEVFTPLLPLYLLSEFGMISTMILCVKMEYQIDIFY